MREILFKAKRADGKGWVEGDLNQSPTHYECQIIENGVVHYSVLKDTTKIFEGDHDDDFNTITWCDKKHGWTFSLYNEPTSEIIFCHCYHCEGNFDIEEWIESFVVTGNIHDKN